MSQFGMDLIDSQIHWQGLSRDGQKTVHVTLNGGNTDMISFRNIKVGQRIRLCKSSVTVVTHITGGCVNDDRLASCQDRVIDFLGAGRTVNVNRAVAKGTVRITGIKRNIEMGNAVQYGNVKRLNAGLFNIEQMYDKI